MPESKATPFLIRRQFFVAPPDADCYFTVVPFLSRSSAKIRFSCPACQQHLSTAPAGAGSKMACPSCGQRLEVPAPNRRDASSPSEAETDDPRPARPYCPVQEENRGVGYVVAAVCGVVGLKVLVPLLTIVILILLLYFRLSLMR